MPLSTEDQKHLTATQGYVELGMWLDANAELEEIDPEVRHFPEVLVVRVKIYRALEKWELLQVVAKRLALYEPDSVEWTADLAESARHVESLDAAKRILLDAVQRHSDIPVFHFMLACVNCKLGEFDAAKRGVQRAIEIDPRYRGVTLEHEDLEPLWGWLAH